MLDKLSKGDEVITNGGIAGTVTDIGDNFVTVEVADGVRVRVQKRRHRQRAAQGHA